MKYSLAKQMKAHTRTSTLTKWGMRPALMTSWIWVSLPAVMLDRVQAASFWMLALLWQSNWANMARAPESSTAWVCSSVPVTMLPMARREGVWGWEKKSHFKNCLRLMTMHQTKLCKGASYLLWQTALQSQAESQDVEPIQSGQPLQCDR